MSNRMRMLFVYILGKQTHFDMHKSNVATTDVNVSLKQKRRFLHFTNNVDFAFMFLSKRKQRRNEKSVDTGEDDIDIRCQRWKSKYFFSFSLWVRLYGISRTSISFDLLSFRCDGFNV